MLLYKMLLLLLVLFHFCVRFLKYLPFGYNSYKTPPNIFAIFLHIILPFTYIFFLLKIHKSLYHLHRIALKYAMVITSYSFFSCFRGNYSPLKHEKKRHASGATLVGKFSLVSQGKICLHLAYKIR